MPLSRQAFASLADVWLILRDAFEMSVSPLQNRVKPPPVPEMPTVTRAFGVFF